MFQDPLNFKSVILIRENRFKMQLSEKQDVNTSPDKNASGTETCLTQLIFYCLSIFSSPNIPTTYKYVLLRKVRTDDNNRKNTVVQIKPKYSSLFPNICIKSTYSTINAFTTIPSLIANFNGSIKIPLSLSKNNSQSPA